MINSFEVAFHCACACVAYCYHDNYPAAHDAYDAYDVPPHPCYGWRRRKTGCDRYSICRRDKGGQSLTKLLAACCAALIPRRALA